MKQYTVVYESYIQFEKLIGRLVSGNYTFVDGHLYYDNNVIKIRYDLITAYDSHRYKENEIFDYYFDIFEMEKGLKVRINTPLESQARHKLAYIITDKLQKRNNQIHVHPYLHEHRIYLNRMRQIGVTHQAMRCDRLVIDMVNGIDYVQRQFDLLI